MIDFILTTLVYVGIPAFVSTFLGCLAGGQKYGAKGAFYGGKLGAVLGYPGALYGFLATLGMSNGGTASIFWPMGQVILVGGFAYLVGSSLAGRSGQRWVVALVSSLMVAIFVSLTVVLLFCNSVL